MGKIVPVFLLMLSLFIGQHSAAVQEQDTQRIIALSPHAVEMLFAIGAGDRIIATIEYADYPAAALDIPRIGNFTGIQIEKIVALQPDLIIGWKSGNKLADLNKLESLGFKLFYSHPNTITEIRSELIKMGELTGLQKKANAVASKIQQQHQKIIDQYAQKENVSVFYQLWHDPLRTIGPDNWNETLINDCNGVNIFNDTRTPYPVVSLENVLSKNPEVIIIPHHSGSVAVKKELWNKWQHISAVKQKHIFTIDGDLLHRFGPRAIEGLELLCEAIDSAR